MSQSVTFAQTAIVSARAGGHMFDAKNAERRIVQTTSIDGE